MYKGALMSPGIVRAGEMGLVGEQHGGEKEEQEREMLGETRMPWVAKGSAVWGGHSTPCHRCSGSGVCTSLCRGTPLPTPLPPTGWQVSV